MAVIFLRNGTQKLDTSETLDNYRVFDITLPFFPLSLPFFDFTLSGFIFIFPNLTSLYQDSQLNPTDMRYDSSPVRHRLPLIFPLFLLVLAAMIPDQSSAQDFEEWLRREQQQYEDFRAEQNRAFADMLRRQWNPMQSSEPETLLEEDKPVEMPVAEPEAEPETAPVDRQPDRPRDIRPPGPPGTPSPPPAPIQRPEERREPAPIRPPSVDPSLSTARVSFFGLNLDVPYDPRLSDIHVDGKFNAEAITSVWEKMSGTEIESSVDFYKEIQRQSNINDWGLARLMFTTGETIYRGDRNLARLYTWFMLIQSGYKARTGFNDNGVLLMLAAESHIFGTPFFRFDDVPFFMAHFDKIPPEPQRIFTYQSDFPGELVPLSLQIRAIPGFTPQKTKRDLSFQFQGETIRVQVEIDRNLIAFYEFFPQTELEIYFNAPVTYSTASGLKNALSEHVKGRSEREAVHLLLRFVQTAFGYKIDPDNFGREKPLFPEETLFYDYSDCEDRAILFSFLVRELLGMEVVGLRYPGHIAAAVKFSQPFPGDSVTHRGNTYHVCDPTYINAGPGMAMDQFKNTIPKIITINR